jgi:HAMP domain-containing protein
MKIKTRLTISVIIVAVLFIVTVLGISVVAQRLAKSNRLAELANIIEHDVIELDLLIHDYLLNHEERSIGQYNLKYQTLTAHLAKAQFNQVEEKVLVNDMRRNHKHLGAIFDELTSVYSRWKESDTAQKAAWLEQEKRLTGRLLVKSQIMASAAFRLHNSSELSSEKTLQKSALFISLLLTVLFLFILIILLWNYLSVVPQIAKLEEGLEVLGTGNLDHKVGTDAKDEVGQLSRSFDQMTSSLKKLTVTREELMKEIVERKRINEQIESLNRLKEELIYPGHLNEKLKLITECVVKTFYADFARIWIIKPGDICDSGCFHVKNKEEPHICRYRDKCLHLLASSGRYSHLDGKHRRVPFGCYKIGRLAAGTDPKFVTNDVIHDGRVHDRQWARNLGLVSFAGYRLLSKVGMPIGVMALFSKKPIFSDDDIMLEDLANTSAQIIQLAFAEEEVETLRGILPLCSFCKKIRDDKGYWEQVDVYIHKYSEANISHSVCPECMKKHYPDIDLK